MPLFAVCVIEIGWLPAADLEMSLAKEMAVRVDIREILKLTSPSFDRTVSFP